MCSLGTWCQLKKRQNFNPSSFWESNMRPDVELLESYFDCKRFEYWLKGLCIRRFHLLSIYCIWPFDVLKREQLKFNVQFYARETAFMFILILP